MPCAEKDKAEIKKKKTRQKLNFFGKQKSTFTDNVIFEQNAVIYYILIIYNNIH